MPGFGNDVKIPEKVPTIIKSVPILNEKENISTLPLKILFVEAT